MKKQLTDKEKWSLIGFIKISHSRHMALKALKNNFMMPSEIARITGMRPTQVSNALIDLKRKNLVVCMNEYDHKGRIYQNTDLGMEILAMIENPKE